MHPIMDIYVKTTISILAEADAFHMKDESRQKSETLNNDRWLESLCNWGLSHGFYKGLFPVHG